MIEVTQDNKIIAKTAARIFGGIAKVHTYWDDNENSSIGVLSCFGSPQIGVTSYATVGLSDAPLHKDNTILPMGLELVGACGDSFPKFDNALATAAFYIINSKWGCFPGSIFPDMLSMYNASTTMCHLLFVPPILWDERLETLYLETKTVAWLQAIPVSDAELEYAKAEGPDKLEDLFEKKQIDVFDLERPSIL
jgi:hypothetical protein